MTNSESFPPAFCLHQWLVQPDLNRITGPAGPVQIEPRVMAVLLVLAARPNTVVTRLDLLDEVWSDAVVGEEILTRAVSELRRVFGDNARRPEYIETIRHHGYRLIAPLTPPPIPSATAQAEAGEVSAPEPKPATAVRVPAPTPQPAGFPLRRGLVAMGVLAILMVGGWLILRPGVRQGPVSTRTAIPLTTYPGREYHPALSTDGTRVAFAWAGPGQSRTAIYIKQRNAESALQVSDEPGWAAWPAWAPDGQTVAFVQTVDTVSTIGLVPSLGGAVRWLHATRGLIEGLDWSPDGNQLVFAATDTVSGRYRLFVCDLASSAVVPVPVTRADNAGDFRPRFGPSGRRLAWIGLDRAGRSGILVAPAAGGAARQVTTSLDNLHGLAWTADGEALVYAASAAGISRLWEVPEGGGPPDLIATSGQFAWNPAIARGTGDLVFEEVQVDQDLWRVVVTDRESWQMQATSFVSSTRWESGADFRPDGQAVAFISARSGRPEIWLADANGAKPRKLTELGATALSNLLWSPAGDHLACNAVLGGETRILIVALASGRPQQMSTGRPRETFVAWGAGGADLLVAAAVDTTWQIYRLAVDNSEAVPLTRRGGLTARESADGRTLYFTRPDRPGLWRRQAGGRITPELVLPDLGPADRYNWRLDGGRILWVVRAGGTALLASYDLATGRSSLLAELPGMQGSGLAVLPGHDVFVYPRRREIAGDLMLLPAANGQLRFGS